MDGPWPPFSRGHQGRGRGEGDPREVQARAHSRGAERCGPGGQDTAAALGGFDRVAVAWTFVAPELAATPGIAGGEEAQVCGAKAEEA